MVNFLGMTKKKVSFNPLVHVVLETSDEFGQVYETENCQAHLAQKEDEQRHENFDLLTIPYFHCVYELFNAIPGAPMFPEKDSKRGNLTSSMKKKPKKKVSTSSTLFVEMSKRSKTKTKTKTKTSKDKRGIHRPKSIPGRETSEQMKQRLSDRHQKTVFEKYAEHERNQMIAQHDAEHAEIVSGPIYLIPADLDSSQTDFSESASTIDLTTVDSARSQEREEREEVITEVEPPMNHPEEERRKHTPRRQRLEKKIDFSARKWALSSSPEVEQADAIPRKESRQHRHASPPKSTDYVDPNNSVTSE